MAKIANSNPKTSSGGYQRMIGDEELGELLSRSQSTVIANGNELEKIIFNEAKSINKTIDNNGLDEFIESIKLQAIIEGVYICDSKTFKESSFKIKGYSPDFLLFSLSARENSCLVIELKDGDNFDTKKSSGELNSLKHAVKELSKVLPLEVNFAICCFNQVSKEAIVKGFKNRFTVNHAMTGRELCEKIGVSYEKVVQQRKLDAESNFDYFISKLVLIPRVKIALMQQLMPSFREIASISFTPIRRHRSFRGRNI